MNWWTRFCLRRAEIHRDAAWNPCSCYAACSYNWRITPGACQLRDDLCADHIKARDKWYARYDRAAIAKAQP